MTKPTKASPAVPAGQNPAKSEDLRNEPIQPTLSPEKLRQDLEALVAQAAKASRPQGQ